MLRQNILKIIVFLCVCSAVFQLNAQTIKVNATKQHLNEVFIELMDRYDIQFSFDDKLLSKCIVSDSNTYESPDQAISNLIKNCNLVYEIQNDVFVVFQNPETETIKNTKTNTYLLSGWIVDQTTGEPLPFSSIQLNSIGIIADVNGNFSIKSSDSIFGINISHLGYYQLDTILKPGNNQRLAMFPFVIGLQEVVVNARIKTTSAHIGDKPGMMKLNHQITSFLPGNNDNTIFNLLRLQPGVMAAAEQSSDYIIWGSYKGQNLILFDKIPLFSLSSLNDEMGVVNPLIIKDVEVLKGGCNAQFGGRVGGVVNITGNTGNPKQFGLNLNMSNQAISGLINIPIAEKYALQLSFRHSIYDLFNLNEFLLKEQKDLNVYESDYKFQDFNLKFSGRTDGGDNFYISLLGNTDESTYQFTKENKTGFFSSTKEVDKQQLGGTFSYNKNWKKAGSTTAAIVYSNLNTNSFDQLDFSGNDSINKDPFKLYSENSISEFAFQADHVFPAVKKHSLNTGLEYFYNSAAYNEGSSNITQNKKLIGANRIGYFIKDNISISDKLNLQPGIRIDFPLEISKPYIQPRIDFTFKPLSNWSINLAWGMYSQYISENAIVDDLGNYRFLWNICDDKTLSVLNGMHYVGGFSYNTAGFDASVEGYYKTTNNLSRFVTKEDKDRLYVSSGEGRVFGIDVYVKKEIKKHEFWVAYTISKSEELFDYFSTHEYTVAPQDQRHEVKTAALLNFYPFFFSANYVYGSGLAYFSQIEGKNNQPYNRLDIAFMYHFNAKNVKMETGLSIINLLNSYNYRYNNFLILPKGNTVYSTGMPFTPAIFLNICL